MSFDPTLGWSRSGFPALVVLALLLAGAAAALWSSPPGPPVVDAGDLATAPPRPDGELIVTGEWVSSAPAERGCVVVLRGRDGGRVACHFEDVPATRRLWLDRRLHRAGELAVCGRRAGVADGQAVLRGCRLLD